MSIEKSPNISKKSLYKIIGSKSGQLGREARIELKKSGLIRLLNDDRVDRQKGLRILRHLKHKGLIKRNNHIPTSALWRTAAIQQLKEDRAAREAEVRRYAFSLIQDELSQEALDELDPLDKRYAQRRLEQEISRNRGSALHANFSKQGPISSFHRRNENKKDVGKPETKPRFPQKPDLVV